MNRLPLVPFAFLTIFFLQVSCNERNYAVEDHYLECWYEQYQTLNIDPSGRLDTIEQIMIAHEVLEDASGQSYLNTLKRVRDEQYYPDVPIDILPPLGMVSMVPSSDLCPLYTMMPQYDSTTLANAAITRLLNGFDSMMVNNLINPELVAGTILTELDAQDLEHELFRNINLSLLVAMVASRQYSGLLERKLPPGQSDEISIDPRNVLRIMINERDEIFVNDEPTALEDLSKRTKHFLTQETSTKATEIDGLGTVEVNKGVLQLNNAGGTSYDRYVAVQDELANAYDELRDSCAYHFFQTSYDQLNKDQAKAIRKFMPKRISEAEPQ